MADPLKNPEQRSNGALWCLILGGGLMALAYALGVGAVLTALITNGDPVAIAGSIGMAIAVPLTLVVGLILAAVGGVWILIQVIVDSRGESQTDRYSRDVER
jgi:hypothetical protein